MRKTETEREDKLFNFRPVFFSAVFLCLGIVFYYQYHINGVSARWLLCLIPIAATPFFFCRTREKLQSTALAVMLLGIAFFVGFFGFSWQLERFSQGKNLDGTGYVSGRVVEKREYSEALTGLVLDDLQIGENKEEGKLVAYLSASFCEEVELSDEVLLYGEASRRTANAEDFVFYVGDIGDNVRFEMRDCEGAVTGQTFDLFLFVRARAERAIEAGMDKTPAAVTKAVLFGDTSGIEAELYDNIRMGGIAHIFAVSGLHVGALFSFCLLLLQKTGLRRLPKGARFALSAGILLGYTGICGFSASVVRATVICLTSYAAKLIGSRTDFLQSLGAAAVCILLVTPSALFEVGFQLSFAACLGIAFLKRPIGQVFDELGKGVRKIFPRKLTPMEKEAVKKGDTLPVGIGEKVFRSVTAFLSVSLAAQIATAPLLLHYFGYLSGAALLLNCLFVPFISAVFSILLLLVTIVCLLPTACASALLFLPNVVWSGALLLFELVDFSAFALTGWAISGGACFCYYAACTFCSDKWNLGKPWKIALFFLSILAFAATMVALNV